MMIYNIYLCVLIFGLLNTIGSSHDLSHGRNYTIYTKTGSHVSSSSSSSKQSTVHFNYSIPAGLHHPVLTDTKNDTNETNNQSFNSSVEHMKTVFVNGVPQNQNAIHVAAIQPLFINSGCITCNGGDFAKIAQAINCNHYGCIYINGTQIPNIHLQPLCDFGKGLICALTSDCDNGFLVDQKRNDYLSITQKSRVCNQLTEICCRLNKNTVEGINQEETKESLQLIENSNLQGSNVVVSDVLNENKVLNALEQSNKNDVQINENANNKQNLNHGSEIIYSNKKDKESVANFNELKEHVQISSIGFESTTKQDLNHVQVFSSTPEVLNHIQVTTNDHSDLSNQKVINIGSHLNQEVLEQANHNVQKVTNSVSSSSLTNNQNTNSELKYVYGTHDNSYVHPKLSPKPNIEYIHLTNSHVPDTPITYVYQGNSYLPPQSEVSESKREEVYENLLPPKPIEHSFESISTTPIPVENLPKSCAAALMCVPEEYCTKDGYISNDIVYLTKQEKAFKVPVSDCFNVTLDTPGKCCRDPNYTDPWPATILGQYNNQAFGSNNGQYTHNIQTHHQIPNGPINQQVFYQYSNFEHGNTNVVVDHIDSSQSEKIQKLYSFNTSFGEIPWQAMILNDRLKTILCGGVILDSKHVLTTDNCIKNVAIEYIAVKGGEWELGRETKLETKPFQIRKVKNIVYHPKTEQNNLILLELDRNFDFDSHLHKAIFDDFQQINYLQSNDVCYVTGWGKEVLQLHLMGAKMHRILLNILDNDKCPREVHNTISDTKCAKPLTGYNICDADFGSGLMCGNKQNGFKLYGIYDHDNGCDNVNQLVSFTKVDTKWLNKYFYSYEVSESSNVSYITYNHLNKKVRKVCKCTEEEILE